MISNGLIAQRFWTQLRFYRGASCSKRFSLSSIVAALNLNEPFLFGMRLRRLFEAHDEPLCKPRPRARGEP
jgi:hypothetical protein